MATRVVSVDLGQATDNSAAAVLDRLDGCSVREWVQPTLPGAKRLQELSPERKQWGVWDADANDWFMVLDKPVLFDSEREAEALIDEQKLPRRTGIVRCLSLKIWPLGTQYLQVVSDVMRQPFDACVVDYCGVGRGVYEMFGQARMDPKHPGYGHKGKLVPVVTVASNARMHTVESHGVRQFSVPKVELVNSLVIAKEQDRLRLPASPETELLLRQLDDYRQRVTKAANLTFGNVERRGAHDDLIAALAMGVWYITRFGVRKPAIFVA